MLFFFLAVYVTVRFHVEMGIKKLLPKLTNASKRVTFEEMRGSVIAVDASMLLHRGAYGCAAGRSLWKCHRQVRLNSIIDSMIPSTQCKTKLYNILHEAVTLEKYQPY